ncbi:hypothetical protein BV25DRAFT_1913044 [Artomyces pyxidatus]|uniref:Uncharacterized protein n=1 Tax=Artomyces pyxidatus TaxID=48021 RepID=A0ACB8TDE4_9AGAM|nr:hypothetical protein BV25DRAFT_1913044 [Artomyces pyxidatus]
MPINSSCGTIVWMARAYSGWNKQYLVGFQRRDSTCQCAEPREKAGPLHVVARHEPGDFQGDKLWEEGGTARLHHGQPRDENQHARRGGGGNVVIISRGSADSADAPHPAREIRAGKTTLVRRLQIWGMRKLLVSAKPVRLNTGGAHWAVKW